MQKISYFQVGRAGRWLFILLALVLGVFVQTNAEAFDLIVTGSDGVAVPSYRWLVEEDLTFHVDPSANPPVQQAINFHRSYMPVVAEGNSFDLTPLAALPTDKHYYVSVLPAGGYTISGGPVKPGQATLEVVCPKHPIPTSQISVFVFEDNMPINNSPDLPAERGLGSDTPGSDPANRWQIILEEAGGKYGASGGQVLWDAFGNNLGTTYREDCDANNQNPGSGTHFCLVDGNPIMLAEGDGTIFTDAEGFAKIKYLPPAKYGVLIDPPEVGGPWYKTTTIEGTHVIDAWVKANNGPLLVEFGTGTTHIFTGYVREFVDTSVLSGGATISGTVRSAHFERSPLFGIAEGAVFPEVLVGLNIGAAGGPGGQGLYVGHADPELGTFSIPNVPPGTYQVVLWDINLDMVISFVTADVPEPAVNVNLGDILVPEWFGHLRGRVFFDKDADAFWDGCVQSDCSGPDDEPGIDNQAVLLRWRDGTVNQITGTGFDGSWGIDQVFPFFNWQVLEVDFARYKATGATFVADAGGLISPNTGDFPDFGRLQPQIQPDNDGAPYRTEQGEVLTQGVQVFAGMTNIADFAKENYVFNNGAMENGGISGIVFYDITRAEDDPENNVGEEWQPGIPRVQVNLYHSDGAGNIQDQDDPTNGIQLADTDNYPFDWYCQGDPCPGGAPGPEDVDDGFTGTQINLGNGVFDMGDAIEVTWTDSWDDNLPTDCPNEENPDAPFYLGAKCYDGLANFNQLRPAVFDGGYAFGGWNGTDGLVPGIYIVEVAPPPGYKVGKSQDRNVDFGDIYIPSPLAFPPDCVGDEYVVPAEMTLFTGVDAPLAGETLNHCDRKEVQLTGAKNAPAEFFLFTEVPISAHFTGVINNDLGAEFDPFSPNFQEKPAAPFMPVAIRDFTGREVSRVYSDQYGAYNGLVPSTFTVNIGNPSGMSPAMMTTCINDAGPILNPGTGLFELDPYYRREFAQSCFDWQFMPGSTTYLDTPTISVAAFAGRALDCEFPDGTPVIYSVGTSEGATGLAGGAIVPVAGTLLIQSQGTIELPNPAFDPFDPSTWGLPPELRDFGFGATAGTVTLGGTALTVTAGDWTNGLITASVAGVSAGQHQLMVTRDNGRTTVMGVTVTVGPDTATHVFPAIWPATPIQDAIDAASTGDLILVEPGVYNELVILHKDVQLQGSGAPGTIIDAIKAPSEKIPLWKDEVEALVSSGSIDLLPGQDDTFGAFPGTGLFPTEVGPGIMVLSQNGITETATRIDGFTVLGSDSGGAVMINGYADNLEVSNNRLIANQGVYGGGIRSGHPVSPFGFQTPVDAENNNLNAHHNHIAKNGSSGNIGAAGGGVSIYTGTDNYEIADNYICGNFTNGSGGGIGHEGVSPGGRIANNKILFNHDFHQAVFDASGGGISIAGVVQDSGLSTGSGSVEIDSNLIQGNFAGAGDGGGIRLAHINGQDIEDFGGVTSSWYQIDVVNNMIVDNIAGLAGGGIALQDAVRVNIIHNTVAHNDSTATAAGAVQPGLQVTAQQPAGIISRAHSPALLAFTSAIAGEPAFSDPLLVNNIVWQNRSFYFALDANPGTPGNQPGLLPDPATPDYRDLALLGANGQLSPEYCTLTSLFGFDSANYTGANNNVSDPSFVDPYFNVYTAVGAALDEGGNFIDVDFEPRTPGGDYHITDATPPRDSGTPTTLGLLLNTDFDGDSRDTGVSPDIGADEYTNGGGILAEPCEGDINGDKEVNFIDLGLFRADFGRTGCNEPGVECPGDINGDGSVNFVDLGILREDFGRTDCP